MYQIEMSLVFIRILREDEDVVDVHPYKDPQVFSKDIIHDMLERRWCITQAKVAERSNHSILQRLRTHGIFGNNEWDVDLLFTEIQFNNLTSNSLRLSPFGIDEGQTPHFPLDFPE